MQTGKKNITVNIRVNPTTKGKLDELTRVLSARSGTTISKTQAIEIAINALLEHFAKNKEQATLI